MKRKIFITVIVVAVAIGIGIWFIKSRQVPFAEAKEIKFSQSLAIKFKELSLDEKDYKPIACAPSDAEAHVFAYLKLNGIRVDLLCSEEYMGGITLAYSNAKGEPRKISLAIIEGDAGSSWEIRSWLTKAGKKLLLESINLTSQSNPGNEELESCGAETQVLEWDPKAKDFLESSVAPTKGLSAFTPPINIDPRCLHTDGSWKGF